MIVDHKNPHAAKRSLFIFGILLLVLAGVAYWLDWRPSYLGGGFIL
jgi:hypothetical protein